jgi:hypothetical protein
MFPGRIVTSQVFRELFSWALIIGSNFVKKSISLKTICVREEEENKERRVSGEKLIVCGEEARVKSPSWCLSFYI